MNITSDPNVTAALAAVGADQTQLATDLKTQVDAGTALAAAVSAKAAADSAVAADQTHLQADVQVLFQAITNDTGVVADPGPASPAPAPAVSAPASK